MRDDFKEKLEETISKAIEDGSYNLDVAQGIKLGFRACYINAQIVEEERFDFEAAYKHFPRKEGKQMGIKKCKARIKSRKSYESLITAIKNYAEASVGKDLEYVYKFSNFMENWEDWIELPEEHDTSVNIRKLLEE